LFQHVSVLSQTGTKTPKRWLSKKTGAAVYASKKGVGLRNRKQT
jgi:hypothetical protein